MAFRWKITGRIAAVYQNWDNARWHRPGAGAATPISGQTNRKDSQEKLHADFEECRKVLGLLPPDASRSGEDFIDAALGAEDWNQISRTEAALFHLDNRPFLAAVWTEWDSAGVRSRAPSLSGGPVALLLRRHGLAHGACEAIKYLGFHFARRQEDEERWETAPKWMRRMASPA